MAVLHADTFELGNIQDHSLFLDTVHGVRRVNRTADIITYHSNSMSGPLSSVLGQLHFTAHGEVLFVNGQQFNVHILLL